MNRSVIATISLIPVLVLLGVLALTPDVDALTDPFAPSVDVVDCGRVDNIICRECCDGGISCPGAEEPRIFCCRDPNRCVIHNPPPQVGAQSFPDILLDLSAGGSRLTFARTEQVEGNSGRNHFEITLQQIFLPLRPRSGFTVRAQLTGEGAAVASLLYAVAFLGLGADALDALQANGYPYVSLVGAPPTETCQERFPAVICATLANQLSQGINASLAIGTSGEREPFLQGLQALGFGLCQVVPE